MALDQQDHGGGSTQFNEEEWLRAQLGDAHQFAGSGNSPVRRKKKSNLTAVLLVVVMGLVVAGVVLFTQQSSGRKANPNDADDLGQGIVNASGLRGHMVTHWQNGKVQ